MAYSLYVQDILLPDEKILHHAKVHYVLYFPGLYTLLAALALMYWGPPFLAWLDLGADSYASWMRIVKFCAVTTFIAGIAMILRAWITIYSTELVVTDQRVLVKIGVSTATTAEIDRARISSVVVTKPLLGRILDYGWICILGYSGNISGLPPFGGPHEIQRYIYHR